MLGLMRAEWRKSVGNRLLVSFLVWIIPIGIGSFFVMALLVSLVSERAALAMATTSSGRWTTDVVGVWFFVIAFPANVLGRLLPVAFMSVLFAGEYQWGTWRFVLPRSDRGKVFVTKAITGTFIILLSFIVSSIITGAGQTLLHRIVDLTYGPAFTKREVLDFAGLYAEYVLLGAFSLLILAGYAAIGAVLTRSILGGLLAGFGLSVLEPMSQVILFLLGRLLERPQIANLYQFTVTYNLDNARSWFVNGQALPPPISGFTASYGLASSLVVLAIWTVGLMALSIFVFKRQDITS